MKEPNRQFKAKLYACGLHKSKTKGTPAVILVAKTKDGAEFKWTGWLSQNAKENTIKKLIELGFAGRTIIDLTDFGLSWPEPPLLDIEIEDDGYTKDGSTEWTSKWVIKWINLIGKGGGTGVQILDKQTAIQEFAGMNFGSEIMQIRQGMSGAGADYNNKDLGYNNQNQQDPANLFTADDIPF